MLEGWHDQSDSFTANGTMEKVTHQAPVSLATEYCKSLCYGILYQVFDMLRRAMSRSMMLMAFQQITNYPTTLYA